MLSHKHHIYFVMDHGFACVALKLHHCQIFYHNCRIGSLHTFFRDTPNLLLCQTFLSICHTHVQQFHSPCLPSLTAHVFSIPTNFIILHVSLKYSRHLIQYCIQFVTVQGKGTWIYLPAGFPIWTLWNFLKLNMLAGGYINVNLTLFPRIDFVTTSIFAVKSYYQMNSSFGHLKIKKSLFSSILTVLPTYSGQTPSNDHIILHWNICCYYFFKKLRSSPMPNLPH